MITERSKGTIPLGNVQVGDFVLTHMGRFRRVEAVHEQGVLPVLEITTHSGRVLKLEGSHPLLTTRGWVEAKDLTTDDVLAEVHKAERCGTDTVSREEARVLGYLIGDGAVKYKETAFTNQDQEAVADFIACVESIGFKTTSGVRAGKFATINKVCVISGLPRKGVKRDAKGVVRKWRERHGIDGKCSYDKEVPAAILAGTDDIVAEFVAAYWSCDGMIHDRRDLPRSGRDGQTTQTVRINCTTVSEPLARGLQRLLTRLGMSFRLRRKVLKKASKRQGVVYTSWILEANGQDTAAKFMQVIGPLMRHEKRGRAAGMTRKGFDRVLNPDPVVSIREAGEAECRCLTVEEDHSFAYEDLAVHNSILVGVMWPAWTWANDPSVRWLCAANEGDLATRDSLSCRNVVQSEWYRKWFPDVQLVTDQNVKTWYQTSKTGHRLATTVNSRVTGKKGDILLTDDPNDAQKVESEADRKRVINWWKDAFYDRVNDFKTGRRVVIGQRTHRHDLQGFLLETGEFEELRIPEEFEPAKRTFTGIGWTDPRQEEGEKLRPERFGDVQIAAAKKRLGTAGYRAKHQQDPMDRDGYRFKAAWLERRWRWSEQNPNVVILEDDRGRYEFNLARAPLFATCDPASSSKRTADYTVFGVWANTPRGDLIWVDCIRRQVEIPDQPKLLAEVYAKHNFKSIGIEAVASNQSMFQFAQRLHLNTLRLTPKGLDKLAHAQGALILAEGGGLWLPEAGAVHRFPLEEVVNEMVSFTGTDADTNDDVIDVISYACDMRAKVSSYQYDGNAKPTFRDPTKVDEMETRRRASQFAPRQTGLKPGVSKPW